MTFPRFDPEQLITAVGLHVSSAFEGVPSSRELDGPMTPLDIYVIVDPEAAWQVAQMALDAFGAHLSDQVGSSTLSPPMEYEGRILLRLRTVVPASAVDTLIPG